MFARLLVYVALACAACTGSATSETRVRTALDVLRDVVDPAYEFATELCIAREREAVVRAEAGDPTGEPDYLKIKAGCVDTRAAFRAIREAHDRAATLLERGYVREAEYEVERVRETWRALKEKKPP